MSQKLDTSGRAITQWLERSVKSLGNHSDRLNAINVFPVADGDTGSNLYLTARAGHDAVSELDSPDVGGYLEIAARAAMESARGNSGTLLAVFLSGLAEPLIGADRLTAPGLAAGLERAKVRAWSALSDPVDGTMLAVINAPALAGLLRRFGVGTKVFQMSKVEEFTSFREEVVETATVGSVALDGGVGGFVH